ncbi:hypothetical protein VTN96DRAFT_10372 [Rasamsonia emersonii]|uniref:Uncharacterized protein n=1 Tax=Rasamsonia emersonii (strain ATCC 16479 / CBS 393.64 / IMI 116815) TaxID=1408163 RepID=A0A0F4YWI4_RASE3|nr:hypothetical protein T310_3395 [Rasamsonia emersonii CBS 393.64]KKA22604.1 hypothetical protein T310_3395 [Rasamsonia emersonii CBS 393.64]
MPGFEASNAVSDAPQPERPLPKARKSLPRRRDATQSMPPIEIPPSEGDVEQSNGAAVVTPTLPLTPPKQKQEYNASTPDLKPCPVPLNHGLTAQTGRPRQFTPPTPDTTPPRARDRTPGAVQPSMSSRAESFKTAQEGLSSDEEPESRNRSARPSPRKNSPLANGIRVEETYTSSQGSRKVERQPVFDSFDGEWVHNHEGGSATSRCFKSPRPRGNHANGDLKQRPQSDACDTGHQQLNCSLTRGRSLRDRVQESRDSSISPSVKKFGEDICWFLPEEEQQLMDRVNSWRLSGCSTTSTIEAMVIELPQQARRTLRHSGKRASLRSVSSPNPPSTRTSLESSAESQRRLVRKSARITNRDRRSISSNMSAASVTSSQLPQKLEVIPVVVIPERRSSLKASTSSSRNNSKTRSQGSGRRPTTAPEGSRGTMDMPMRQRKRTMSDSMPSTSDINSRGRGFFRPPVPPRSSSLSAPTSRNNSRSASLTSESLRIHTEAMMQKQHNEPPSDPNASPRIVLFEDRRGSEALERQSHQEDDAERLRAPSLHFTQASVVSSSPGPVEINEATAVTFFPHNNESVLLIDPKQQPESRAVQALRGRPLDAPVDAETPKQSPTPATVDSPLKNPRPPPDPPAFKVTPPTPMDEADCQLGAEEQARSSRLSRRLGSVRRALSARRQSAWSASRAATNRTAGKDMDSRLHPFWRPRGFWDDFKSDDEGDGPEREGEGEQKDDRKDDRKDGQQEDNRQEDEFVSNSLGLPQKRVIFSGPISLARRMSKRSRGHRSSQGNVGRSLSCGIMRPLSPYQRRVRFASRWGMHVPLTTLRNLQRRVRRARQLRQEEKWEARRAKLKQSIGEKTPIDPFSVVGPYDPILRTEVSDNDKSMEAAVSDNDKMMSGGLTP